MLKGALAAAFVAALAGHAFAFELVAGGDVLLDRGVRQAMAAAGDPARVFAGLTPVWAGADLVVANLECPLATTGPTVFKPFMFCGDPALAPVLRRAGFTAFSLANNHAYDAGRDGLLATKRHLEAAGIVPVGADTTQAAAGTARYWDDDDGLIALLACVDMPLEGLAPLDSLPEPARARSDHFLAAVREARARADWVVVMVHWGAEYLPFEQDRQHDFARELAAAGADVIIGHHPHVIQPVARIDGALVFYSLGNLVFDASPPRAQESLLARLRFTRGEPITAEVCPLRLTACAPRAAATIDAVEVLERLARYSPGVTFQPQDDGWWKVGEGQDRTDGSVVHGLPRLPALPSRP